MLETLKPAANRPTKLWTSWQRLTRTNKVNVNESERFLSMVTGFGLTLYSLIRYSPSGFGFMLAGGYLLYRGLTGHCPAYEAAGFSTASRTERLQFKSRDKGRSEPEQPAADKESPGAGGHVDEAVWESFPASDPPAWTVSRTGTQSEEE